GVPQQHRARMVRAHLREQPHHRDESLRHDVLSAGGSPRLPRDRRGHPALPVLRLGVVGRAQAGPQRAGRAGLLVLALRRRGVGGGVHRRLRHRAMTPPERERAAAQSGSTTLEMPAPTAWPMILALGVTLLFAGLVTHLSVTAVGLVLMVAAAIGWWWQ